MPIITAMTVQRYARIGGLIYLAIICLGLFGEVFVRNSLIVSGDASATAGNIVGSRALWRAGIAGDLLMHVLDVPLIVILYFCSSQSATRWQCSLRFSMLSRPASSPRTS